MEIADNIIREKLKHVYFLLGSGKTTIANGLAERYGGFVYRTDYERGRYIQNAEPDVQPALCREVSDYWALDPEDARQWEKDIVREFTPMALMDLIALSGRYDCVLCEGDLDIAQVAPVAVHAVMLYNCGETYDFFERPEQKRMLEDILNRPDLTEEEKAQRVQNAYEIAGGTQAGIPKETERYGLVGIAWDRQTPVEVTVEKVAEYFGLRT